MVTPRGYIVIYLILLIVVPSNCATFNDKVTQTSSNVANVTRLLYQYFLICGRTYFCNPDQFTFTKTSESLQTKICPDCKCDRECLKDKDCCPDVIFTVPLPVCVSPVVVPLGHNMQTPHAVFMINSCVGNVTDSEWSQKCRKNDIILKTRHIEYPPVTSRQYIQTFKNRFCAECNGVSEYSVWSLSMECAEFTDFNFLSTYDDILGLADTRNCRLSFRTVDADIHHCFNDYAGTGNSSKCNKTGTWVTHDPDIELACNSAYSVTYGVYENIFCFMCNPPKYNAVIIDTCNTTGLWDRREENVKNACARHAEVPNTAPYKNVFCFICNRNASHQSPYIDVHAAVITEDMYTRIGGLGYKRTFEYSISFDEYNFEFYERILASSSKQTVTHPSVSWTDSDMSRLLLYDYSVTGHYRYCRRQVTPYKINQEYNCSCDPLCFYDQSLECCIDMVLEYPVSCQRPHITTEYEPMFRLIEGCFESNSSAIVRARCWDPVGNTDIFSALPVTGENDLLYTNFDCLICNQVGRVSRSENENYTFSDYIPWIMDIECNTDLNIRYHASVYDVIKYAKELECSIAVWPTPARVKKSCSPAINDIRPGTCNTTGAWEVNDPHIQWACERSPLENHYKQYRNVYCFICNPQPEKKAMDTMRDCSTKAYPVGGEEIVLACHHSPEIISMHPVKNVFCRYCNLNDSAIPRPRPISFPTHRYWVLNYPSTIVDDKVILQHLFNPLGVIVPVDQSIDVNNTHIFDTITVRLFHVVDNLTQAHVYDTAIMCVSQCVS